MLKYFIQVVQDLYTPLILVTLLLVVANKSSVRKKWFNRGLLFGLVAALLLFILKATTVLINREFFNIGTISVSVLAGIFFLILLWGFLAKQLPEFHEKALSFSGSLLIASLLFFSLPDVLLYPTKILLPGETIFSTDFLFKIVGYLAGICLTLLTSLALYKVGLKSSYKLVCLLLTLCLSINMLDQIATVVQFLFARRIIPMKDWIFSILVPIINYNDFFLYAIMFLTFLLPLFLWKKSLRLHEPYSNPAQHRKLKADARRSRKWSMIVVLGYILAVFTLTTLKAYSEQEVVLSPPEPMRIAGEQIFIPVEQVNDGHLHRFHYTAANGIEMRFIVIKKNAVAYGVGLDACDICGPTGYYERDDKVICALCDVIMNVSTIGFKGGCNPVPLAYTILGGNMVIEIKDLEAERNRFK